jgi:hypothetical protein
MAKEPAYTSDQRSEDEAAKRFGEQNWRRLTLLQGRIEQQARSGDIEQGFIRIAQVHAYVRQVQNPVLKAHDLAVEAVQWFDPHQGDFMPADELLDLPDLLAEVREKLRSAEATTRAHGRKGRPGAGLRWRHEVGLIRAALREGIKPLDDTKRGPAWAYAFIALGLDKRIAHSALSDVNRKAWQRRLAKCNKALDEAAKSPRKPSRSSP